MWRATFLVILGVAACGGNSLRHLPDGGVTDDAPIADAAPDAPPQPPDTAITQQTRDAQIYNNIVQVGRTGKKAVRPVVEIREGAISGSFKMDDNRYYNPFGAAKFWIDDTGFKSGLSAWQKARGVDAGSTEGNPKVDSTGHLLASSPMRGAGTATSVVFDDFDGQSRPTGKVDIGADQYI